MGAIIGSIVGALVILFILLFVCRAHRRRRSVQTQERQMTEGWLSMPFNRGVSHQYQEFDMPAELPAAYGREENYRDSPRDRANDTLSFRSSVSSQSPSSSASSLAPMTFSSNPFRSSRDQPVPKLVDYESVGSPVGPISMPDGDSTVLSSALEAGPSRGQDQDPFMDSTYATTHQNLSRPYSIASTATMHNLPALAEESEPEDRDMQPSRASTNTNASVAFDRPNSASSSDFGGDSFTNYAAPSRRL